MLLPLIPILVVSAQTTTSPLAELAKKVAAAKTVVIKFTFVEESDFKEAVGQKMTFAIDRTKKLFCIKNADSTIVMGFDGRDIVRRLQGEVFRDTLDDKLSPYAIIPGFEAFLDAKASKWKVVQNPPKNGTTEVALTMQLDSLVKTIKLTFAKDGSLTGYSNANGTKIADRFAITSVKFDVPVTEADLKIF